MLTCLYYARAVKQSTKDNWNFINVNSLALQLDKPGKKPKFTHICVLFTIKCLLILFFLPLLFSWPNACAGSLRYHFLNHVFSLNFDQPQPECSNTFFPHKYILVLSEPFFPHQIQYLHHIPWSWLWFCLLAKEHWIFSGFTTINITTQLNLGLYPTKRFSKLNAFVDVYQSGRLMRKNRTRR